MTLSHRSQLEQIRTFPQLIRFLRDEMGWPIETEDFEDLTFTYSLEELGIDPGSAAKSAEIRRLRPLVLDQPWGIFFVEFEPKRLPVVALRRILSAFVMRKRASANSADRMTWETDDLLFISSYGEDEDRQLSFAHFSPSVEGGNLPTLKVLGWDNRDTALHLDAVAETLTQRLVWPANDTDAEQWRESWRSAFTLRHREVITTSRELSIRLAEFARAIRDRINTALPIETAQGSLTMLMNTFREALVHDLTPDGFADMYAQTIAYGLLSARIADPTSKTTEDFAVHMRTNPLLRDLMTTFLETGSEQGGSLGKGLDFDELGVNEVVQLLDDANMEAVLRDFGDRNPQEDPVIHFYELFLKEYDADKRMKRGVFYTPRPVVSYIVRSLDKLLRSEFGLADGLADIATWGDMVERHEGLVIPKGVASSDRFVTILDPATGTGTFLVETIDVVHHTLVEKWKREGCDEDEIIDRWNEYVPESLLPRLYGYELLMAPYAIAHLKIGLKLHETGYLFGTDVRARIYLTNSLEPASGIGQQTMLGMLPALAHEAESVNEIKRQHRFTVVLGNPPYSGESANRGKWITALLHGGESPGPGASSNYFEVDGKPLGEKTSKWLNNDYVRFLRFAQWRIEMTGCGVVGMITDNGYLDSPTFRGMRQCLVRAYDKIRILNLHGNSNKKERCPDGSPDHNVFDIQQGVAVTLFARGRSPSIEGSGSVQYSDLWGTRELKYPTLLSSDVEATQWTALHASSPEYLFVPQDDSLREEYERGWFLKDVMPLNGPGMTTARDAFVIDFSDTSLVERARTFVDPELGDAEVQERLGIATKKGWNVSEARRLLREDSRPIGDIIRPVLYRPFDERRILYHPSVVWRTVKPVMWPMMKCANIGLIATRQTRDQWDVFVTRCAMTHKSMAAYDINTLFPLYHAPSDDDALQLEPAHGAGRANMATGFVQAVSSLEGDLEPRDLFCYIYGCLHSPTYRSRYVAFLTRDFPRIPVASSPYLIRELSRLGSQLVALHLMEADDLATGTRYEGLADNRVERVRYSNPGQECEQGSVWINAKQYFDGVPPEVWEFQVGGYQVCEKWLKDRKGRTLSADDIAHYQKIVVALSETMRLMQEIDAVIEAHGGWPGAFRSTASDRAG